ncbi:DUF397 domain-containing protein [Micromonospora sp. NPDC000207]|uniref:DUF397 domain-containing protein n=1 Tax=Micromonospora sp. NPDC000207 TaxID=3154246 RepID=UPI00331D3E4B
MRSDETAARWRKSSRSGAANNCVEVADNLPGVVGLRDSKDPTGSSLTFEPAAWSRFIQAVKQHEVGR